MELCFVGDARNLADGLTKDETIPSERIREALKTNTLKISRKDVERTRQIFKRESDFFSSVC